MNTYHLPNIIGLAGAAGAGKDTAAGWLWERHDYRRVAFADPLRAMLAAVLRLLNEEPEHLMADRDAKEQPIPALAKHGVAVSPRAFLQAMGTEGGRSLHPDLWVAIAAARLEQTYLRQPVVITDARFPNEWQFIRNLGGQIWRIERPGAGAVRAHVSETATAHLVPDVVLPNTGSLAGLYQAIDDQLTAPGSARASGDAHA